MRQDSNNAGEKPVWIFKEMIWPAVAGNVAWSFFTLAIAWGEWGDGKTMNNAGVWWARLAILGALSAYVVRDYMATREKSDRLPSNFIGFDASHSAAVVVYALAVAANKPWSAGALAVVFLIGAIGHWRKAWMDVLKPEGYPRGFLIVVNVIGLSLALLAYWKQWLWLEVVAVIVGTVGWWVVRFFPPRGGKPPGGDAAELGSETQGEPDDAGKEAV